MNKNARPLVASTLRRIIITALLALIAMTGWGQVVWEEPLKAYTTSPLFEVRRVELTTERSILYVRYSALPGYWFQISEDSYLQTGGKQYGITGSDSIQLGNRFVLDGSGRKDFVLYFEPLPTDTKEFDFIEGLADGDFKVFGIHDKDYVIPAAPVPAEYQADYTEEDQLEDLKYSPEPATIHFKALNYRKGMRTRITVQYVDLKNPGNPVEVECCLNDEGKAELSLPLGFPQRVWADISNIPWGSDNMLYLAPGKEVTVLIDMLHDDTKANSKFVGYKGFFAKFDREMYQLMVDESEKGYPKPNIDLDDVHDVQTLMNFYDEARENRIQWIEKSDYGNAVKKVALMQAYEPPYMPTNELDSLARTKEFTDYLLQHYMRNLRERKMVLDFNFVMASKYYVMADDRGINGDLARYCYYLPKALDGQDVVKPLIEDSTLSALYDKYTAEYYATIAVNKQSTTDNIHYLDMTDVAPEDILQTILDRYKGKKVLIDIWATWCGPCRYGHRAMAPMKEEMKDKDIQFIYISPPSSPFQEWKDLIRDISGDHYYVTDAQYRHLLHHYKANGIPTYAIYDANGIQTYTCCGFPGVEVIKEELEKAHQNQEQ